ncbi:hypothetical protein KAZ57_00295 [Patescibacteria group bacterium]|nr:hypothetical protein [Patescibacteria group bacterium]
MLIGQAKIVQWVNNVLTHFVAISIDLIIDMSVFSWLYSSMPKINHLPSISATSTSDGFSHIFVLLSFLAVLGAAGFFMRPQTSTNNQEVLGTAQATSSSAIRKGFSVMVVSTSGNWDFFEYLCSSYEECTESLTSGFQLSTISGGQTDGYEIFVEPSNDWNSYKFIKYYVKSGWTDSATQFTPSMTQDIQGAVIHKFDGSNIQAVVAPVTPFTTQFYNATSFSDN